MWRDARRQQDKPVHALYRRGVQIRVEARRACRTCLGHVTDVSWTCRRVEARRAVNEAHPVAVEDLEEAEDGRDDSEVGEGVA